MSLYDDDRVTVLLRDLPFPAVRPDLLSVVTRRQRSRTLRRRIGGSMGVASAAAGTLMITWLLGAPAPAVPAQQPQADLRVTLGVTSTKHPPQPDWFRGVVDVKTRSYQDDAGTVRKIGSDVFSTGPIRNLNDPSYAPTGSEWVRTTFTGQMTWKNLDPSRLNPATLREEIASVGVELSSSLAPVLVNGTPTTELTGSVSLAQRAEDPLFDADVVRLYVDDTGVAKRVAYDLTAYDDPTWTATYTFDFSPLDEPVVFGAPAANTVVEKEYLDRYLTDIACAQAKNRASTYRRSAEEQQGIDKACTFPSYPGTSFTVRPAR